MKVAEIFYSLQGEGGLLGVPSVFVRSSGCNLRCTWCDTPYTSWQPEGEDMSVAGIVERVAGYPARHVVVTGGEPMIQPQIGELTRALREAGLHITIETAGTVDDDVACDLMSISPKLANSTPVDREGGRWVTMHERTRINVPVLRALMARCEYQLKFVVSTPEDVTEVQGLAGAVGADAQKVILMPEGTDAARLKERGLWLAQLCLTEGYRYSPRLHVDLWGDRRGV